MPILPLEPFLSPESLLASPSIEPKNSARWWALHTRPRTEKTLARKFVDRGMAFFLPLHQQQWRNKGRLFRSHLPLFPGYLFLHGDDQDRWKALETNLVARCLVVEDQERLHSDLIRVYQLIRSEASLTPEDHLGPGTPVVIIEGPMAGVEGIVLRRGSQLRVFVEVQFLQRGVSVEIESWMIKPGPV
jgi:transcriptional antiterminator RfaH